MPAEMPPMPADTGALPPMPDLLLDWYMHSKRSMPWRDDPTPYRVMVSEFMLQQTQVATVIPYFNRFVAELPDFSVLAGADDTKLLGLWQGLGYYRRATALRQAAQVVAVRHGGVLPADLAAIRALPGVGDYTAGAVASIAFGIPEPAVDGNVLRVAARLTDWHADVTGAAARRMCADMLRAYIPGGRAGEFTQALMELGALICRPGAQAKCGECPLRGVCAALRGGCVEALPIKPPPRARREAARTVLLVWQNGRLLLNRRGARGLLAGLYEPVNLAGALSAEGAADWVAARGGRVLRLEPLGDADHVFTHITWHMRGLLAVCEGVSPTDGVFAAWEEVGTVYPMPAAFRAFMTHPAVRALAGEAAR